MSRTAATTVLRQRDEVERLWQSWPERPDDVSVSFHDAPGDRGTEVHAELRDAPGKLGEMTLKLTGKEPLAKLKDSLRRFKQQVETGEIARSEAVPEGESLERKLKQRPAQPLEQSELDKAGV